MSFVSWRPTGRRDADVGGLCARRPDADGDVVHVVGLHPLRPGDGRRRHAARHGRRRRRFGAHHSFFFLNSFLVDGCVGVA